MRFKITKVQLTQNLHQTLRQAGYFNIVDKKSGLVSFVRRLSQSQHYPRFHLYVEEDKNSYKFNLHLDQKKASYKGQRAHNAEYQEPLVNAEAERIQSIIK